MGYYLDIAKLANLVRNKRHHRGLREIAKEIGNVSPSTISRVENSKTPDMDTFLALCDWLGVPPSEFFKNTEDREPKKLNNLDDIAVQLLSNKDIDSEIANALSSLIRAVYNLSQNQK